jgi:hypothetical protein
MTLPTLGTSKTSGRHVGCLSPGRGSRPKPGDATIGRLRYSLNCAGEIAAGIGVPRLRVPGAGQQGRHSGTQAGPCWPQPLRPAMGVQHGASIADGLTTAERSPPRKLARRRGPSHSSDRVCPGDRGHHTDDLASFAERLAAVPGGGVSLSRSRKSTTESPRSVTREGLQCHLTIALGRLSKLLAAPVPNHIDCPSLGSLRRLRALLSPVWVRLHWEENNESGVCGALPCRLGRVR